MWPTSLSGRTLYGYTARKGTILVDDRRCRFQSETTVLGGAQSFSTGTCEGNYNLKTIELSVEIECTGLTTCKDLFLDP